MLEWPPLLASARFMEAKQLGKNGAYEESAAAAADAYFEAGRSGAWDVAAKSAIQLIFTLGYRQARFEDGSVWARHAEVALALAGDREGLLEARRLANLATMYAVKGMPKEARSLSERALAMQEKALGPSHPDLAGFLANLANTLVATGAYAEARVIYQRALALEEQALGPFHPEVASTLDGLATVQRATGAYSESRALLDRALHIKELSLGPSHLDIGVTLTNLANLHRDAGENDQAYNMHLRALRILEKSLGPDHPAVAVCLVNLGSIQLLATQRPQEALLQLEQAVRIYDIREGIQEGEPDANFNLARALFATGGDTNRALVAARKARDAFREAGEAKAEELAQVEQWLAEHTQQLMTRAAVRPRNGTTHD